MTATGGDHSRNARTGAFSRDRAEELISRDGAERLISREQRLSQDATHTRGRLSDERERQAWEWNDFGKRYDPTRNDQ